VISVVTWLNTGWGWPIAAELSRSASDVQATIIAEDARRVLHAVRLPDFRPDCRWIAIQSGVDLDDVNRALHLLIHERRLVMSSPTSWMVTDQ